MKRRLLHFLLIGVLLFAALRGWRGVEEGGRPERPRLFVSAVQVEGIRSDAVAQLGRPPSQTELEAFIAAAVEDEMLYREARALGLDGHDAVVRRRLVQNMRFLRGAEAGDDEALYDEALELGMDESDPVVRRRLIQSMRLAIEARARSYEPTDKELGEYLARHAERFATPARVRFSQVFFDPARRNENAERDARALLARLSAEPQGEASEPPHGDPFLASSGRSLQSEREIAKLFGPDFAQQIIATPPGSWQGPFRSAHGQHLVRVEERKPGAAQELDAVRSAVRYAVLAERAEAALADALDALRERYEVEVEGAEAESPVAR